MPPLPALLAHPLLDINRDFERVRREAGELVSLLVWADFLRVIPDDGISLTDLPPAARISRRAVRPWLGLERHGWLTVEAAAPRVKIVRLTDAGTALRDRAGDLVASTERAWSVKVGDRTARSLRAALEAFVRELDLELPHYPMIYGTADARAVGGTAVAAKPGPPRIPPHGTDWVPVVRRDGGAGSDLPMHTLLSQALMAFTIDYEEPVPRSMSVSAILAEAMRDGSLPLDEIPAVLGVNGSGKSNLERHGVVRVRSDGQRRVADLTPVGVFIRDSHEATIMAVTQAWSDRHGQDQIRELSRSLAEVDAQLPNDLPDHVLVRFVPGIGFHDVSMRGPS